MSKNNIKEDDFRINETQIIQIIIANLANNELDLSPDDELIEYYDTNDIKIKFDHFINLFFDNNTYSFEINDQYRYSQELLINNKVIKSLFKNYTHNNLTILDIIKTQHIKNKKIKISESKSLSLINHINKHNSLFDFKIYKSTLSLDDILYIFNNKPNKNSKKYFRFKIIVNYHYDDVNENVSICFNYLTKIPSSFKSKKIDSEYLFSKSNKINEPDDESENYQQSEQSINYYDTDINTTDEKKYSTEEESEDINKKYFSHENIIYSNYKNKNLSNSSFEVENFSIDTEDSTVITEVSSINDINYFNVDLNNYYENSNIELAFTNKENIIDKYSSHSKTEYIDDDNETENDYDTEAFNNFDIDHFLDKCA